MFREVLQEDGRRDLAMLGREVAEAKHWESPSIRGRLPGGRRGPQSILTMLGALLCPCPASSPSPVSDSAQLPAKGLSWFYRSLERKDHRQTWAKSPKAKRRRKRRIPMSPRSLCQPTPCFSETRKPLSKGKTPMLPSETYRKLLHQCGTVWEKNKNK